MAFLEYLLNISRLTLIIYSIALFLVNIPVSAGIIFSIKLIFKKKPSLKLILSVILLGYFLVFIISTCCIDFYFTRRPYYKEFKRRIALLDKMIQDNPGDASNYFSRGHTYTNHFYYQKALADFQNALSLNPNMPAAHNYIGYLYMGKKKYKEAEKHFLRAIELSPNFSKPYFNLAVIYYYKKDFDQALEYINKAIAYEANFQEAYAWRDYIFSAKEKYGKSH
jgi:hypothetical protein